MLKFFRKKMARELSGLIAISVVVIFTLTGFLIYNSTRLQLVEDVENEIFLTSEKVVENISSIFEHSETITKQMALNQELRNYIEFINEGNIDNRAVENVKIASTLKKIKESYSNLSGAWVAGFEGNYWLDQDGWFPEDGYDITSETWYDNAKKLDTPFFAEPYTYEGILYLSCIQSVRDNNDVIGVVSSDLSLDNLPIIMEEHKIGEKGSNILVSAEGTYIYVEDTSKVMNEKATNDSVLKEYVIAALQGESDIKKVTYNGVKYYLAYEPISINGWAILSLVNEDEMMAPLNHTISKLIISFILACLVLIALNYFIIARRMKPIEQLTERGKVMASGDFTMSISKTFIKREDEVGELAKAFESLTNNMNDVMSNINEASEQVASGSRQVSESSIALSQGATEQASSVEQLTASIEEITLQTKKNAQNANQSKNLADTGKHYAIEGNAQMQELLSAMIGINESSNNISKIIKVIDEIAFQTNILALNASVESARAGEHGKGFAVVAEEVKNLAQRSANASKETATMIEDSIKKVKGGTRIANSTADALNKIVEGSTKASVLIGNIAVASNEQTIGIEQINKGIIQIANVVQTTSAMSEEAAAASEELSTQAEMLKNQVSAFKLKKNNNTSEDLNSVTEITPQHKIIDLSDKEFGKY